MNYMMRLALVCAAIFSALYQVNVVDASIGSYIGSILEDALADLPAFKKDSSTTVKNAAKDDPVESPKYHLDFNAKQLAEIFGCNHYLDVPNYFPAKVTGIRKLNRHISHQVSVNTLGKDFKLNLKKSENTVPDTVTTEIHSEDGNVQKTAGLLGEFSSGHVQGDDESHVGLHHNGNGISGYIRTYNDMLIIKPLPKKVRDIQANHIVYRLFDIPSHHPINQHIKFTESKMQDDGVNIRNRRRRSVQTPTTYPKKTMELMIVGDWKLLEFYGEDVLPSYLLNVANVLAGMFRDRSLEYPIDVVLTRTVILKTDVLQATGRSDQLAKFKDWARQNNDFADDTKPDHVDIAYLLSRIGGCSGKACGLEGLAYVNMCGTQAVAVGRDRGIMSTTTMAHEIGHILNAYHDNTARCPGSTFIMSSGGTGGGEKAVEWSKCSSDTFKESFLSDSSKCFDDLPTTKSLTDTKYQLFGQVYDASTQCKFIYGNSYSLCGPYEHRCDFLFCRADGANSCQYISFPAAHGTRCGVRKWCIKGICVPDGTPEPPVVDGNWGHWGDYTKCSRPCGVGVQWMERACNSPEPKNGGKWCDPKSTKRVNERGHYRTCNKENCLKDASSGTTYAAGTMYGSELEDRNKLCYKYKRGYQTPKYVLSQLGECQLACGTSDTSGVLVGVVQDGTPCTIRALTKPGLCIHGECVEHGCDFEINSGMGTDRCGTCGGSGTYCKPYSGKDLRKFSTRGSHQVTVIPAGVSNVKIVELKSTINFIAVSYGNEKNKENQPLLYRVPQASTTYINKEDNIRLEYVMRGFNYADQLILHGTLKKELTVWCFNYYYGVEEGIEWSGLQTLTVPEAVPSGVSKWVTGDWQKCSQSCGGEGKQKRDVYCRREDNSIINPSNCDAGAKPAVVQGCNLVNCPSRWVISEWTTCTKTCATGKRSRTIACMVLGSDGVDNVVADGQCSKTKPTDPVLEDCNAEDCFPRWEVKSDWGACSARCGGGNMTRTVQCWRIKVDSSDKLEPDYACSKLLEPKPQSNKVCNADEPCPTWRLKYAACSTTCGTGQQTSTVVCQNDELQEFDASWCTNTKPVATTRSCDAGPCTGQFWISEDGACSKSCGGGQLTTTVKCQDIQTKNVVDESQCTGTKPSPVTKACKPDVCPRTHIWKVTYSACTVTCGGGKETSIVHCYRLSDNAKVADSDCEISEKNATVTRACNEQICINEDYHWVVTWGTCQKTCGPGVEETTVKCTKKSDNSEAADSVCVGQTKPAKTSRSCNLGECPAVPTYAWNVKDLGCSVTCGTGQQTFEIECLKTLSGTVTVTDASYCDAGSKPSAPAKSCDAGSCYQIQVHHNYCDVKCGPGKKIREMTCMDIRTNGTVKFKDHCTSALSALETNDKTKAQDCTGECKPVLPGGNFYGVGCYQDNLGNRVFTQLTSYRDHISDWLNLTNVVIMCRNEATTKGYQWFGIQYFGECMGSNEPSDSTFYKKYGHTKNCYHAPEPIGVGYEAVNFVYHIGSPIHGDMTRMPPIISLGCLVEENGALSSDAVASSLSSNEDKVKWERAKWDAFTRTCAWVNQRAGGGKIFGVDNTGSCIAQDTAQEYLASEKFNVQCFPYMGALSQYFIFEFQE